MYGHENDQNIQKYLDIKQNIIKLIKTVFKILKTRNTYTCDGTTQQRGKRNIWPFYKWH